MSEETTVDVVRLTEQEWLRHLPPELREAVLRRMKRPLPELHQLLKWNENEVRATAFRLTAEVHGLRLDWEYSRQEAARLTRLLDQSRRRERSLRAQLDRAEVAGAPAGSLLLGLVRRKVEERAPACHRRMQQ